MASVCGPTEALVSRRATLDHDRCAGAGSVEPVDRAGCGSPCSVAVLNSVRADSAQAHLSRWAWAEPDRLPGHRQSGPGLRADPGSRSGANLLPRSQRHDATLAPVTDPCLLPALRVPFQMAEHPPGQSNTGLSAGWPATIHNLWPTLIGLWISADAPPDTFSWCEYA